MPTLDRKLRRRRSTGANGIPHDLRDWFAGEVPAYPPPWNSLLSPHYERLPEYWAAFVKEHPGATPPAGHEHIARAD